jgi:hypothetical protein
MDAWEFFGWSDFLDHEVLRQLSHIRPNWELSWDHASRRYTPEDGSYAQLLNELIDELGRCDPPLRYHENENRLGEYLSLGLGLGFKRKGNRWFGRDGEPLTLGDYLSLLEQGGFKDIYQKELLFAASGRIQAAISRGQVHFDEIERSHQIMLAGVLAIILYYRSDVI